MPRKEYVWSFNDPPPIAPHTLAKHRILREYVQSYIRILTANPKIDRLLLNLVDGFAGGGIYVDPSTGLTYPGSPTILLDGVRAAEVAANHNRAKPLQIDARYFFIDHSPSAIACLRHVLSLRDGAAGEAQRVRIVEGAFEERLDAVVASITSRGHAHRAIFVLDQYGYTAAPPSLLRRIFDRLPNAEVFLTLAVGWAVAYLPDVRAAAEKMGIAGAVLDRLGEGQDGEVRVDDAEIAPRLQQLQIALKDVFTTQIGSTYFTPFFIVSRESNRSYWFLHMANSPRAHDVVKALHWDVENHFEHYGGAGLAMLGYDPDKDPAVTGQMSLPFRFDDPARTRTHTSLVDSLGRHIASMAPQGIAFDHLFAQVCNETPATKAMLGTAVHELCRVGELEKLGASGESRATTTAPKADDIIRVARQRTFSFGSG
jgi:three-Cys-motif partner protein